jgi:hypothetical protein
VDFGEMMAGLRVEWTSGNMERSWDWTFRSVARSSQVQGLFDDGSTS